MVPKARYGLGPGEDSQMRNCGIVTVRLPLAIATSPSPANVPGSALTEKEVGPAVRYLTKALAEKYKTWLPIIDYRGWMWARLCAQVYLDVSDFEMAGNALKVLCEQILNLSILTSLPSPAAFSRMRGWTRMCGNRRE